MLTIKRKQTLFSWFTIGTSVLPFVDMAWWAQTIAVIIKKINYTLQKRVVTCKKNKQLWTRFVNYYCQHFTAGWTMTQYFLMSVYVYLPILMHYGWVSRLWTKDIDLRHQGQFLPTWLTNPDKHSSHMINNKNSFQFPRKYSKKARSDDFVF